MINILNILVVVEHSEACGPKPSGSRSRAPPLFTATTLKIRNSTPDKFDKPDHFNKQE